MWDLITRVSQWVMELPAPASGLLICCLLILWIYFGLLTADLIYKLWRGTKDDDSEQ